MKNITVTKYFKANIMNIKDSYYFIILQEGYDVKDSQHNFIDINTCFID